MAELAIKDRDSRVGAESKLATVELTEAQTAQTVVETGLMPSQLMAENARTVEQEEVAPNGQE
jgi:hypothetical protein